MSHPRPPSVPVPPRWAAPLSGTLCMLALADTAYLTYAHFTTATVLACPSNPKGFVDCAAVTTSSYSHPFGIPVVIPGLIWCAAMLVLCSPPAWRAVSPWASRLRLAGSTAGIVMVLWLVYAELVKLHHLCEYCTVLHCVTGLLFIVILFATAMTIQDEQDEQDDQDEQVAGTPV